MKLMLSCRGGWELVHTTGHRKVLGRVKGLLDGDIWGRWWPDECGADRRLQMTLRLDGKELIGNPGPWHPWIIPSA